MRRLNYKGSEKLADKAAIITGGDSGIGRSVAVLFAREGADVAIVYLPEEQPDAEETRQAVEKEGRRCLLIPGNVKGSEFCESTIKSRRWTNLDASIFWSTTQRFSSTKTQSRS